jgi:hypothetical protein
VNSAGGYTEDDFAELRVAQTGATIDLNVHDALACASTSDRHYVLHRNRDTGVQSLSSYDDTGSEKAAVALPLINGYDSVAAIANKVYLTGSAVEDGKVVTKVYSFERRMDGGSESLVATGSFVAADTPSNFAGLQATSIDLLQAINLPAAQ